MIKFKWREKNGNGEGSVVHRKDDRWQASIWNTLPTGERKREYHYAKTRKECTAWITTVRIQKMKGISVLNPNLTFLDWLRKWLTSYCINIRDSTRMNYTTYIEKHICHHKISRVVLKDLTTNDLQDFVVYLQQNGKLNGSGGLSSKTIRNIFQMIYKALKQAVGNQYIASNPANYITQSKASPQEACFLSKSEQHRLLCACQGEYWSIGVILMLFTGIRIGKLLALQHDDLQYESDIAYLNIQKSLQRVTDYKKTSGSNKTILRVSAPKTNHSIRKIPLLPEVRDILEQHISNQKLLSSKCSGLYEKNPHIICNELGKWIDPTTFRKCFTHMVEKAGLSRKITPHMLRHTFASQSLQCGMDLKHISSLLGHYSTDFTARTYVHTDLVGEYLAMSHMRENTSILRAGGSL